MTQQTSKLDSAIIEAGFFLSNHFGGDVYAKETHIPAGAELMQHKHKFEHLSILASGRVIVECDGYRSEISGPSCITIKAHAHHKVIALTDAVWFCVHSIHAVDQTDIDHVDGDLIEGGE